MSTAPEMSVTQGWLRNTAAQPRMARVGRGSKDRPGVCAKAAQSVASCHLILCDPARGEGWGSMKASLMAGCMGQESEMIFQDGNRANLTFRHATHLEEQCVMRSGAGAATTDASDLATLRQVPACPCLLYHSPKQLPWAGTASFWKNKATCFVLHSLRMFGFKLGFEAK